MGIKFTIHTEDLDAIADSVVKSCARAEHKLAEQVMKDTAPFVPASGNAAGMSNRTRVVENQIIYPGPYARYLYFGKLMVDPETGSPWAKKEVKKVETDRNLVFSQHFHGQAQSHWFEASKAQNAQKWKEAAREAIKEEFKK